VKGLQLRKRLREVQAKAQSITQQAQREQETAQPPGQETLISEKELFEAKLTDANGVTKAPLTSRGTAIIPVRRERRSVPVMNVVKQLDEEMAAIMMAVNDVKAQKAHLHDTADSFFERTIELTQEASLHTSRLVDAEKEVATLRNVVKQTSAELRATQGQLAAAQVEVITSRIPIPRYLIDRLND
jgi:chromosome segregation ATPase